MYYVFYCLELAVITKRFDNVLENSVVVVMFMCKDKKYYYSVIITRELL